MSFTVNDSYAGYSIEPAASSSQTGPLDNRPEVWEILDPGGAVVTSYSDYASAALTLAAYNQAFYALQIVLAGQPPPVLAAWVNDFAGVAELLQFRLFSISITELVIVTDVPGVQMTRPASVSENAATAEAVTVQLVRLVSVSESTATSETVSVQVVRSVSKSENAATAETIGVQFPGPISKSENAATAETIGIFLLSIAIGETVAHGETVPAPLIA